MESKVIDVSNWKKEVQPFADYAQGVAVIETQAQADDAGLQLKEMSATVKRFRTFFDPLVASAHEHHKLMTASRNEITGMATKTKAVIQAKIQVFITAENERRKAEAQAEADRLLKEHEKALRSANAKLDRALGAIKNISDKIAVLEGQLETVTDEIEAEAVRARILALEAMKETKADKVAVVQEQVANPTAPNVAPQFEAVKVKGVAQRETLDILVYDKLALLKCLVADPELVDAVMENPTVIKALFNAGKKLAGVKYTKGFTTNSTGR